MLKSIASIGRLVLATLLFLGVIYAPKIVEMRPAPPVVRQLTPTRYFVSWGERFLFGTNYSYEVRLRNVSSENLSAEALQHISRNSLWDRSGFCLRERRGQIVRYHEQHFAFRLVVKAEESVQGPAFGFIPICSWRGFRIIGEYDGPYVTPRPYLPPWAEKAQMEASNFHYRASRS